MTSTSSLTSPIRPIRYPAPLRPGDRIGVTAPSSGVDDILRPRLEHAVKVLRDQGFEVEVGECIGTPTHVSALREQRAAELMAMLTDPSIRAVVPPWGGETAIDLLDVLDYDAIGAAEPTWVVGFSDTTTWMAPITLRTGIATLHGQNLMDTPYAVEPGLLHWLAVAGAEPGSTLVQHSPGRHRTTGFDDWAADPTIARYTLTGTGTWRRIDAGHEDEAVSISGRLIGGCVETVSNLTGTPYGGMEAFAREYAPEGLVHYVDVDAAPSYEVCRLLHGMRLAGWFDRANAVLVSRTRAPGAPDFSQDDAVRDALGMLGVPIIADVECGHVPPYLALVNGASTTVVCSPDEQSITQTLA